jgi:hypothetical protein
MPSRLLVLVLDAVETTLVTRWVAEGKLPVLGSAIELGTSGPVQGVEGLYVGRTSASFSTGAGGRVAALDVPLVPLDWILKWIFGCRMWRETVIPELAGAGRYRAPTR